jgi:dipeptidyl aminopeptidase/acylaminoacyl peptidase
MLGKLGALLIKERFNSYDKIEKIECPTLIIHGKLDEVVSCSHATEIFRKDFF